MKRLAISVEGATERDFVTRVLRPPLVEQGFSVVKPISLDGGLAMPRIRREIRQLARDFEHVTTLYDLYAFPDRRGRDADELEESMLDEVGDRIGFIPYIQRHEFEALLFSDLLIVQARLSGRFDAPLHPRLQRTPEPEDINNGYDTCPSRRLKAAFARYDKVVHGPQLAADIGLVRMRSRCPRFDRWVQRLSELAALS